MQLILPHEEEGDRRNCKRKDGIMRQKSCQQRAHCERNNRNRAKYRIPFRYGGPFVHHVSSKNLQTAVSYPRMSLCIVSMVVL